MSTEPLSPKQIAGRKGGLIGGPKRAKKLSRKRRVEIARMGGLAKAKLAEQAV